MALPAVIAVFGPTASGKTAVAERLAARTETEIVSCDALQVYRGLPLLTNQPSQPTHLVAICDPGEEMSVGAFACLAHAAVDELVDRNGVVVICGGTGLYLRAALADIQVPPAPAAGVRQRWEKLYDSDPKTTYERLRSVDAAAATSVHPNDRRRVVRALELAEQGLSLVPPENRLWSEETRLPSFVAGLEVSPEELEQRIVRRTDEMFAAGVTAEVHTALLGAVSRTAEQALGLREIASLEPGEARARLVARTRQYAAYQRKWMRRIPGLVSFDATRTPDEVADAILEVARAR